MVPFFTSGSEAYVLIYFLHLIETGMRGTVGIDNTVYTEIAIVLIAACAVVAAVGPVTATVLVLTQEAPRSTQSQIKPPCMWGLLRIMSKYSRKLPEELPIAWAYSHMM